jgi:hypothetical protein
LQIENFKWQNANLFFLFFRPAGESRNRVFGMVSEFHPGGFRTPAFAGVTTQKSIRRPAEVLATNWLGRRNFGPEKNLGSLWK